MPSSKKANQAQFVFICGDLDLTTFGVAEFTGNDSISSPYDFTISLRSPRGDISADEMINKQATLYIFREGEYFPYSGIVSEFKFLGTSTDYSTYSVRLVPRLWLLSLNFNTRVFQKMSVPDIIEEVLKDAGLSDYFSLDLQGTYGEAEYIVQYQESDLDFISRLMEGSGIWYFFKELPLLEEEIEGANREELVISDKAASFEYISGESEIVYRSPSGLSERVDSTEKESVDTVVYEKQIIPTEVQVKNYNYRTPEVDLSASKAISSGNVGKVYTYGGGFKDTDGSQKSAELAANRIATEQITVSGDSNCRGFRAGFRFTLKDHSRDDCNDSFMIRTVSHKGSHISAEGGMGRFSYKNVFALLPSSKVENYCPPVKTPVPKINGVITATIEASGSDYASLDEMARYKVRMPFDLSDSANYDASKYVRLAQPYSGSNYGIHFPSHEGTEMVLACIDGNPNKPIGIGTVPNANTVSPVVSNNKAQSVIRTAGGNELILDDTDEKQKVTLNSKAKNIILLDDENKKIEIKTTGDDNGNNRIVLDDQNKHLTIGGLNHGMQLSYGDSGKGITIQTELEHLIKIDDENNIITIKTAGGHAVQMDDDGNTITITDGAGKNTVTLDGGGGLSLDSQGEIKITAQADLIIEAANIKMTAQQAIEETANMDVKIKGMNVEAKADMNMTVEGGMNTEVTGMMLKCEGKTMADFKGGAKTTLTGGIVMIN